MKNIFKLTVAGCALSLATIGTAQADMLSDMYVRADAGIAIAGKTTGSNYKGFGAKKFKKTPVFSIGAGYYLNENIRADVNLGYYSNFKIKGTKSLSNKGSTKISQKNKSIVAMVNASYDICDYNNFVPYVTVGIGAAQNKAGKLSVEGKDSSGKPMGTQINMRSKSKTNFAWNAGLGVRYKIQEDLSIDLGYKYADLGKLQTKKGYVTTAANKGQEVAPFKSKLRTNNITLGIIYKF